MSSSEVSKKVVVTGLGMVTPLGLNAESTWKGLLEGRSGIRPITLFDASDFPTRIGGEVLGIDFEAFIQDDPALKEASRGTFFAIQSSEEALKDAGIHSENTDFNRLGIYLGAGDSGTDFRAFVNTLSGSWTGDRLRDVDKKKYIEASKTALNGLNELEAQPFMSVYHTARRLKIRGPVSNSITACAASSQAIGEAYELIKRGDADVMLTGGTNSMLYPLGVSGFSALTALSTENDIPEKASKPFDAKRSGFVMSEGAAMLVLESEEHALRRNAKIYGEVVGYAATADAYRLTDMDPETKAAIASVNLALTRANVTPEQIGYISAHGTSTTVNDVSETRVIKETFGDHARKVPMSSIKSMIGHMITSAGAVEAATCFLGMRDSMIPPTINYETPDPECDLDYVPNVAKKAEVCYSLSNSFGFGGQNVSLVMKKRLETRD